MKHPQHHRTSVLIRLRRECSGREDENGKGVQIFTFNKVLSEFQIVNFKDATPKSSLLNNSVQRSAGKIKDCTLLPSEILYFIG